MSSPNDQCAVDTSGNLKEASDIHWFNDVDDNTPIPSAVAEDASKQGE
jgi:hypothetical protein